LETVAFEVFPHPAMIRLFGLGSVLGYKKKHRREWTDVFAAWAEYRRLLATLERADPLLFLSACIPPIVDPSIKKKDYKRLDDALDGICCAYIASWVWHDGSARPYVRVFGDMKQGHIVVPDRAALPA
jgi:predicted RNase H-like nuclease